MGALANKLRQRIFDKTDFVNDNLETLLEQHTANAFLLAEAASKFEAKADELELDPETAANAVLGLAQQFGDAFPSPSPERTQQIKALVNELIDESDTEFEALTENLFGAALDFETSINAVNAGVDAIASA